MWFAEEDGNAIGRINMAGDITEYPLPGPNANTAEITTGPDGALWFPMPAVNAIGRITTSGVLTQFPLPLVASYPYAIATGPDGALWFTELDSNSVGRMTTSGSETEYPLPTARGYAEGITPGPDGALWLAEFFGDKVARITTTGEITEYPITTPGGLSAITTGPDGNLWFTAYNDEYDPTPAAEIGRAPACALGFNASFASGTLTMNFDMGINTAASFDIHFHSSSGVSMPYSRQISALAAPYAFSMLWPGIPDLGELTVEPVLTSGTGEPICAAQTVVNTAP